MACGISGGATSIGNFERRDNAVKETAAGARLARLYRVDKLTFGLHWRWQQRRNVSDRIGRMGIRARDLGQAQGARDLECEEIFFLRARAIEHLDRVAHAENFELGRAFGMRRVDRLVVLVDEREARVEFVAKRMV